MTFVSLLGTARRSMLLLAVFLFVFLIGPTPTTALAQGDISAFPDLHPNQHVYDTTGTSLTAEQIADLETRIASLKEDGAEVVVYVRAMDATPEETLDQVETLQQTWVGISGSNQDNTVAILINRNPNDANDARAGIYVGSTYDDGNVPRGEQEAIVDKALIPPLRDGDVYQSLTKGLDRLQNSILNGPPKNGFQRFSEDAGGSWLPWAGLATAVAGVGGGQLLFRDRKRGSVQEMPATTMRPDNLDASIGAALANGGPTADATQAIVLSLAMREALAIEPEDEGAWYKKPTIQLRLLDPGKIQGPVEQAAWTALEKRAEDGIVSSKELGKVATNSKTVKEAINEELRERRWLDESASGNKAGIVGLALLGIGLGVGAFVITLVGKQWLGAIAVAALIVGGIWLFTMYSRYSSFSPAGQDVAAPWIAYKQGLKAASKSGLPFADLDNSLPDIVAMGLGSAFNKQIEAAGEAGQGFRAFANSTGNNHFIYWTAYSGAFATSGSSGSSTVSGGGAGGGGGAAGST